MAGNAEIVVVEQGYIRTVISARTIDLGYGVAIEVFGRLPDNCWKEVLRFDCFEREPHWHRFAATGGGVEEPLEASNVAEAVERALSQLQSQLAHWMSELGYPEGGQEASAPGFAENTLNRIKQCAARFVEKAPGTAPED